MRVCFSLRAKPGRECDQAAGTEQVEQKSSPSENIHIQAVAVQSLLLQGILLELRSD
jgi:hypothetical protein